MLFKAKFKKPGDMIRSEDWNEAMVAIENFGVEEIALKGLVTKISAPVGTILPWLPGSFSNNENSGFSELNILRLPDSWVECSGQKITDPESLWHGSHVPNLTGDMFLMGAPDPGSTGGENSLVHNHEMGKHSHEFSLKADSSGKHRHNYSRGIIKGNGTSGEGKGHDGHGSHQTGYDGIHTHTISGSVGKGDNLDNEEVFTSKQTLDNRPNFLSVKYIIKIK